MSYEILPKIFVYNPTCEIAIANGTLSYVPNKMLTRFERDLDVLPMYFARSTDFVLVNQLPDKEFIQSIEEVGMPVPKFKIFGESIKDPDFIAQPKESLEPWGWSPKIHHILKVHKDSCQPGFKNRANAFWKNDHKELYSRKKALEVLDSFLNKANSNTYISREQTAKVCASVPEIEELIIDWKQIVIKAPWSSSGRGLQVLRQTFLNDSITQWINGVLENQTYVMVEPLLDKKYDFSLQYHIDVDGKVSFLGNSFFSTNSNGQYHSNTLGGMPKEMLEYLPGKLMSKLATGMRETLMSSGIAENYCGYLGVDCMLFLDQDKKIRIQPCLEINLRYNMGTLALIFDQYLHPETKGIFKLYFQPKFTFDQFHKEMAKKHPFKLKNRKWYSGYLPLVSPHKNKTFGMYLLLEKRLGV